jgi:hypothetical protein
VARAFIGTTLRPRALIPRSNAMQVAIPRT